MQAMRRIVKTFRRPPTGRIGDRNGGLPRLSDGVAHALRCPASPQRTLLAENLGKPSLWVVISAPWYEGPPGAAGRNKFLRFSLALWFITRPIANRAAWPRQERETGQRDKGRTWKP